MKKSRSIEMIAAAICLPGPAAAQETVIGHIARLGAQSRTDAGSLI